MAIAMNWPDPANTSIEQAIVWNLIDAAGHLRGQAATVDTSTPLPLVAKQRWKP